MHRYLCKLPIELHRYLCYNVNVKRLRNTTDLQIKTKAGKGMENEMQDKTLERVIEYLTAKGWTDSEILDLLRYLAKT